MPRPKVTEELRRRVAKACLRCQESKHKCDGLIPCAPCTKRGREEDCRYSSIERSYGRHRRRRRQNSHDRRDHENTDMEQLDRDNPSYLPECPQAKKPQHSMAMNLPPRRPGMIYDTRGRIVYLGECAASAFLQHLQGFLESDSRLSADQPGFSKLTALEEMPLHETETHTLGGPGTIRDLEGLVDVFFAATCGILDIIDRPDVDNRLQNWCDGHLVDSGDIAVLFLLLACGAQARSINHVDTQYAHYYYHQGRRLALLELTDEPRVETVQAFVLIAFYMLSCSQRNGSFLNLGTAISAAKSLGFHRDDVNAMLPERNAQLRPRIWRSLRYQDLFFCAMMGRTPSTMTTDSYDTEECTKKHHPSVLDTEQCLAQSETLRAFPIMERAISDNKRSTSAPLAHLDVLARELQAATADIPRELRTVTSGSTSGHLECRRQVIRNAHVACSYYFSMMLLTRPFLMSFVQKRCHRAENVAPLADQSSNTQPDQGALAAMDSSIHVIRLIHDLLTTRMLYNNMVLTIAMVFVASLTLCSAYLGRLGSTENTEQAIHQAETILSHFSAHTRQGKRYGHILQRFYKAAKRHREVSERTNFSAFALEMPELFRLHPFAENPGSIAGTEQLLSHHLPADASTVCEEDWQETLLLTSPESSITDILNSFTGVGGMLDTDGLFTGDSQGYAPFQSWRRTGYEPGN